MYLIILTLQFKQSLMKQSCANSKIVRSKSPPLHLDENYLKQIAALNDQVICQAVKEQDFQICFSLLKQLEHSIKSNNYGTYTISKKHYYYHLYVCYYNLGVVHQLKSDNSSAKANLEKAIHNFEKMQGFITNRQENLVFMGEIVKTQLQYCGLLSHCDMHQQAVFLAQKSLDKIIQAYRILQAVCYEQMLLNSQRDTTCSSRERGSRAQMVNFKKTVIQQAELMLAELIHMSPTHKIVSQDKHHFEKIISKISAWKENLANNQNAIRKELKVSGQKNLRNLLGLQMQPIPKQYEIGSLMSLTFKQICYNPHPDPLRLLSSHYLRQLAFHSAAAYFTVATESRFSQSDLNQLRGNMKIDEKYKKLNHDERILKCKILHLKGLEIAGKILPPGNALFGHLAQSFCRNYKFVLDQINEVSQMSSTNAIQKQQIYVLVNQTSLKSQYGFKVVTKENRKREKSKLWKSKIKTKPRQSSRSKSMAKNRSSSQLKKNK